jgi:hypothetical protein
VANQLYGQASEVIEKVSGGQVVDSITNENSFPVKIKDLEGNVTRVRVSGGLTKNMGNYESLRVDVSIEMPCPATPEGVEKAYQYCAVWVPERIKNMVAGYAQGQ